MKFEYRPGLVFLTLVLAAGCGTLPAAGQAASAPGVAAEGVERMPRPFNSERIKRDIRSRLERDTPDNTFKFESLDVFGTDDPALFRFEGMAAVSTFVGGKTYAIEGTYDFRTREAKITRQTGLDAADSKDVASQHGRARADIKEALEAKFSPTSYSVITGIQLERSAKAMAVLYFKAHERVVGHGWEQRYAVAGEYDLVSRKVDVTKRDRLSGTDPFPWILR
ncbi:MAG: hypothetical protein FJZ01_18350 [Candidatus Sericytochromatia bacterium]|nr:hypothetical protein [Candidatus Tanganyikabacteria bacterium]